MFFGCAPADFRREKASPGVHNKNPLGLTASRHNRLDARQLPRDEQRIQRR
jgi:hypothetical protein